jgi:hypothetical protein
MLTDWEPNTPTGPPCGRDFKTQTCACGRPMYKTAKRCMACCSLKARRAEELIITLWHQGLNIQEIAEELDYAPVTIYAKVAALRLAGAQLPRHRRRR